MSARVAAVRERLSARAIVAEAVAERLVLAVLPRLARPLERPLGTAPTARRATAAATNSGPLSVRSTRGAPRAAILASSDPLTRAAGWLASAVMHLVRPPSAPAPRERARSPFFALNLSRGFSVSSPRPLRASTICTPPAPNGRFQR